MNLFPLALTETPVEPVIPESSDEVDQEIPHQLSEQEKQSSLSTSGVADGQMFATTSSHPADHSAHVEATTPMVLDSYIEMDSAAGM